MSRLAHALIPAVGILAFSACAQPMALADSRESTRTYAQPTASSAPAKATVAQSREAAVTHRWGRVVAGDNFQYKGSPKSSEWRVYTGPGHDGNGKRRSSAWYVNGREAVVTGDSRGKTGGMSAKFSQKYGRWETRMRTNVRDSEYHPALLLWPDVKRSNCPEVDFAESTKDTKKIKFFLHYGCAPKQTAGRKALDTTKWHNYAVEWTPTHITGYIDGVRWFTDSNRSHLPKGRMHQTMQLDWFPDGSRTKTSKMYVAWVRVYKHR